MHQNETNVTLKKILTEILELGFNYTIEKPTKLYIQDLNINTQMLPDILTLKYLLLWQTKKSPFTN